MGEGVEFVCDKCGFKKDMGSAPEHGDPVLRTAETVLSVFDSFGSDGAENTET